MDWRSFSERALFRAFVVVVVASSLFGCGRYAVRATEKEYLADRVMTFDNTDQEARAEDSVLAGREGSAGPASGAEDGGGCK